MKKKGHYKKKESRFPFSVLRRSHEKKSFLVSKKKGAGHAFPPSATWGENLKPPFSGRGRGKEGHCDSSLATREGRKKKKRIDKRSSSRLQRPRKSGSTVPHSFYHRRLTMAEKKKKENPPPAYDLSGGRGKGTWIVPLFPSAETRKKKKPWTASSSVIKRERGADSLPSQGEKGGEEDTDD